MLELDEIAALQVANPLLRFGGEDEVAQLDPSVFSNVLGADAIEAPDLGLRNIDRINGLFKEHTLSLLGEGGGEGTASQSRGTAFTVSGCS